MSSQSVREVEKVVAAWQLMSRAIDELDKVDEPVMLELRDQVLDLGSTLTKIKRR